MKLPWGTAQKSVPHQSFSPSSEGWWKSMSQLSIDKRLFSASSLWILSTSQGSQRRRRKDDEHHQLRKNLRVQEGSGSSGLAGLQPSKQPRHRGSTAISKRTTFAYKNRDTWGWWMGGKDRTPLKQGKIRLSLHISSLPPFNRKCKKPSLTQHTE